MRLRVTIFGTSFENKRALRLFGVGRALEETKMDNARYIPPRRWRDRTRRRRWLDNFVVRRLALAALVIVVLLIVLLLTYRYA
jgi:hypothetical protein